jgi:hypothetical protein
MSNINVGTIAYVDKMLKVTVTAIIYRANNLIQYEVSWINTNNNIEYSIVDAFRLTLKPPRPVNNLNVKAGK